MKKFQEKQAKKAAAASQPSAKPKEKKKVKEDEKLAPYVSRTPSGEKKVMEDFESPYAKAYNPDYVEASWYDGDAPRHSTANPIPGISGGRRRDFSSPSFRRMARCSRLAASLSQFHLPM